MKKLFLSMMIAAVALSASAQKDHRNHDEANPYHYKDDRQDHKNLHNKMDRRNDREMRQQIAGINHDYDSKINSIRRNPFMRSNVKNRKIQKLEMERRMAINKCEDRFSSGRHRDYADGRKRW